MITCCGASHTVTSIGGGVGGGLGPRFCFSTTAWMELRRSSPMMYSRWLRMNGNVASRWPSSRISGRTVDGPYAAPARDWTCLPHRETTSLALHLRKTSPTNSDSVGLALGKCHGDLKVS